MVAPSTLSARFSRMLRPVLTISTICICILITAFELYRNQISIFNPLRTVYELSRQLGDVEISVSSPLKAQAGLLSGEDIRVLKISFPISKSGKGCEFIYGTVVYDYPESTDIEETTVAYLKQRHYIVKFKYDLKWRRCESKDLSLEILDLPQKITLQFVQNELLANELHEHPVTEGLSIDIQSVDKQFDLVLTPVNFSSTTALSKERVTARMPKFSFPLLKSTQVVPLFHPAQNLKKIVVEEINARISKCQQTQKCDAIRVANALFVDVDIILALNAAARAGLQVEVISNQTSRYFNSKLPHKNKESVEFPFWEWRRGNPDTAKKGGRLPLHTKIIIFGDDLVISSNSNFNFEDPLESRQLSLLYRDPVAVGIFNEIFTFIRTSLYYPKLIDLNDEVQILFNANRPKGYAASSRLPYLQLNTNEGVSSNAYGILYEMLRRNPGNLRIAMSPLANSCHFYRQQLCLDQILRDHAKRNQLELILNAAFYADIDSDDLLPLPTWKTFLEEFHIDYMDKVALYRIQNEGMSTHHERMAIVGEDLSILGSSNWAHPKTLNTVEIVRSRSLAHKLSNEYDSYDEPWFIAPKRPESGLHSSKESSGNCIFFFEEDLLRKRTYKIKQFSADSIRQALSKNYSIPSDGKYYLIEPKFSDLGILGEGLVSRELPQENQAIESYSSYFCISDRADGEGSFIVSTPSITK